MKEDIELLEIEKTSGKTKKKLIDFYALGVPAILGEYFASSLGNLLNESERKLLTSLGFITGLIDDLFDQNHQPEVLQQLFENAQTYEPKSTTEKLIKKHLLEIQNQCKNPTTFQEISNNVFSTQKQSLVLKSTERSQSKALRICQEKGGYALLLYRSVMDTPITSTEYESIFHLGSWMQFGDDIFDVYDDIQEGTYTWVLKASSVAEIQSTYHQLKTEFLDPLDGENTQPVNKVLLGMARCEIALNQFNSRSSNGWHPEKTPREHLICDMEKWTNIWQVFRSFTPHKP